jgi:hypothetical protein
VAGRHHSQLQHAPQTTFFLQSVDSMQFRQSGLFRIIMHASRNPRFMYTGCLPSYV